MRTQRGFGLLAYALIALAILSAIGGIIWWADQNIATSAGVKKGKAEVQAAWDAANEAARAREAAASAKAAADLAAERKRRRIVVEERVVYVDRNIEKLVDSGRCFQPSGVSCINAALDGKSACRPDADGTVPAAATTR